MKASELRSAVLQLAIQGKLVPQDKNDEPASVLLERINAEKVQLIKQDKIKKEKSLLEITDDEKPFDIPNSWEWIRLSQICYLNDGCSVKNVNLPYLEATYLRGKKEPEYKSSGKFISQNTHAILVDGENSGEVFLISEEGILGSTFKILVMSIYINQDYIIYILKYYQALFRNSKRGAAIPHLDKTLFKQLPIGLPPINEQERILARIEEIMPIIDEYEKLETELSKLETDFPNKLKKSILQYAVQGKLVAQNPDDEPASKLLERIKEEKAESIKKGKIKKEKALPEITDDEKPFEIPGNWEWVRLGEICNKLTDGTHSTPKYVVRGYPFLSVKDMSSGKLDFTNTRFISEKEHRQLFKRCNPEKGDLLLTKVGTTGIPVIVDTDIEFSLFVSVALLKMDWINLDVDFICYVIKSPLVGEQAKANTKGVGNKNWVMRDIANTTIAIPPLAEQKRIVEKVDKMLVLCEVISNKKMLLQHNIKQKISKIISFDEQAFARDDNIKIAARSEAGISAHTKKEIDEALKEIGF